MVLSNNMNTGGSNYPTDNVGARKAYMAAQAASQAAGLAPGGSKATSTSGANLSPNSSINRLAYTAGGMVGAAGGLASGNYMGAAAGFAGMGQNNDMMKMMAAQQHSKAMGEIIKEGIGSITSALKSVINAFSKKDGGGGE
ncbi:MAG: hypothetical protein LW817_08995 [Candidatus Caenarcaniphilales bacterium]|jgi:hypothetical protein|nr:hypothetical protein [Candidatus Caenarcaniphilales bacterium]